MNDRLSTPRSESSPASAVRLVSHNDNIVEENVYAGGATLAGAVAVLDSAVSHVRLSLPVGEVGVIEMDWVGIPHPSIGF
jgi:hypothetical protein